MRGRAVWAQNLVP